MLCRNSDWDDEHSGMSAVSSEHYSGYDTHADLHCFPSQMVFLKPSSRRDITLFNIDNA